MELFYFKLAAAAMLLLASLISGLGPVRIWLNKPNHSSIPIAEAFAGGIFLGAALFHMLPEAQAAFSKVLRSDAFPYANLICAIGFATLLLLQKLTAALTKRHSPTQQISIAYVLLTVLSIHALSEGLALGINSVYANAVIIFIAIIVHKTSESFALAASLSRSKFNFKHSVIAFTVFSFVTPIGVVLGGLTNYEFQSTTATLLEAVFNSFAAGTFLYIATLHNLHHHHPEGNGFAFYEYIALVVGLSLMAGLAAWV